VALYSYARVSTTSQNPTVQFNTLKAVGCMAARSELGTLLIPPAG